MTLTEHHEGILEILTEAAERGDPCPTTNTIETAMCLGHSRVQVCVSHLWSAGLIDIERSVKNGSVRRIQIKATGQWTGWTVRDGGRHDYAVKRWDCVEDADAYMAEAMRGRRYEDVRVAPPTGRRLYTADAIEAPTWSSAA